MKTCLCVASEGLGWDPGLLYLVYIIAGKVAKDQVATSKEV